MNKNSIIYILITCLVFANFFIYSNIITDSIPEKEISAGNVSENSASDAENTEKTPLTSAEQNGKFVTAQISDTKSGDLILVNKEHGYSFGNVSSLIEIPSNVSVYGAKSKNYFVKDINVSLNEKTINSLNTMLDDFYTYCGDTKNVIVTQGVRTYEEQLEMLELKQQQYGENQTIAQTPGYSEHHTGYAFDISTYVNGIMGTFTGENEYKWVHENAHKYGFVIRYPSGKEDVTGISYESWHFRYVGIPHAQYMYRNSITLEEYISMLSGYNFDEPLEIIDEVSGNKYEVYSVSVLSDGTHIPVPSVENGVSYSLSGDNCGNIIVTVKDSVQ